MSRQRIEGFLNTLGLAYEDLEGDGWIIDDEERGMENVVVLYEDPVVIIRLKVTDLPKGDRCALFEELLRLNGSDMLHGAYAVEGNTVILLNTLLSATIDIEEFQATLDAISLSVAQHYQRLAPLVKTGGS